MDWRVTHMDMQRRRHCLVLAGCTGAQAAETAVAIYGDALYLATIRLRATDRLPPRPLFRPLGLALARQGRGAA